MSIPRHSPDGRITVEYGVQTMRMSHEVWRPRVVEATSGEVLLDLWPAEAGAWDARATFPDEGVVELELRRYDAPSDRCTVRIDARARTWSVTDGAIPDDLAGRLSRALAGE